jgi:hypothetical protein
LCSAEEGRDCEENGGWGEMRWYGGCCIGGDDLDNVGDVSWGEERLYVDLLNGNCFIILGGLEISMVGIRFTGY